MSKQRSCPFCNKLYAVLGRHIHSCHERKGRPYSEFIAGRGTSTVQLSPPTVNEIVGLHLESSRMSLVAASLSPEHDSNHRVRAPSVKSSGRHFVMRSCPSCLKSFKRLDVHLNRSSKCSYVKLSTGNNAMSEQAITGSTSSNILTDVTRSPRGAACAPMEKTSFSEPPEVQNLGNNTTEFPLLRRLKLPTCDDEWNTADIYFASSVVPLVCSYIDPDEANDVLVKGIFNYFSNTFGVSASQRKRTKRHASNLAQRLRVAKRENRLAQKALRRAKKTLNMSKDDLLSLVAALRKSVRSLQKMKRLQMKANFQRQSKFQQRDISSNFWKFAKQILRSDQNEVSPSFTQTTAYDYFRSAYSASSPRNCFDYPEWLKHRDAPSFPMGDLVITEKDIYDKIKCARSDSAPCPLDQISYKLLKRCPSLTVGLLHIYNLCIQQCRVPRLWQCAVIKLIPKPGKSIPSDPSTFRPIALTSVVGKVFTSFIKDTLFKHLISNGYLDTSIQKGFINHVSGCQEHQFKLVEAIRDAKANQRLQTILWIDLRNAFGSVDHNLIRFAMSHYNCGDMVTNLISNIYCGLRAVICTDDWCTSNFPYEVGVFQGDPLSVAIFDMVFNLYTDALESLAPTCAYQFSSVAQNSFLCSFADDAVVVTRGPHEINAVCKRTDQFLEWSGLEVNAAKCSTFSRRRLIHPTVFDPEISIQGQKIPFLSHKKSYKYLGLPIASDLSHADISRELLETTKNLLNKVDQTAVSRMNKCLLYKRAVLPRLSWLLSIASIPLSWIEQSLDSVVTKFLKKWVGLAHSAAVSRLFLNTKNGGLQLGQPSDSFKRLQSCNLLRFTKSNDECLRALATIKISRETELSSTRFSAGSFLATLDTSPGCLQSKIKNIKKTITESSNNRHLSHLTSLSVQGQAARFKDVEAEHFALSLKSLPDDLFKWAINGLQDTLPSATNLQLWKKISCNQCPLCHQPQSLCHVLNACPSLLDRGLYKQRHDNTLRLFVDFLKRHLSQQFSIVADLPESVYNFPVDITCTCLRPDIVVWNAVLKKAWMLELSVPFETVVEETKARKERRYAQLVKDANHQYKTELLHLLVGSRGLIFPETRRAVCMLCKPLQRDLDDLFQAVIHSTLKDSFRCWLARRDNIS